MIKQFIRWFWNYFYPEWSDAEVKSFFDKFNNYFELAQYLQLNGFEWKSDGTNALPYYKLDDFSRPGQVFARKWGNCSDFMRLFSEFIRYKRCADRVEEMLMLTSTGKIGPWHYILAVFDRGGIYMISNMSIIPVTEIKQISDHWRAQGYVKFEVIDIWKRG